MLSVQAEPLRQRQAHLSDETVKQRRGATPEVKLDIAEGAALVMVKPGMPYLDMCAASRRNVRMHAYTYQVSGDVPCDHGRGGETNCWTAIKTMTENLIAFKRAGADGVLTYFAIKDGGKVKKGGVCDSVPRLGPTTRAAVSCVRTTTSGAAVLRRIVVVAVKIAVPVILWTITVFVDLCRPAAHADLSSFASSASGRGPRLHPFRLGNRRRPVVAEKANASLGPIVEAPLECETDARERPGAAPERSRCWVIDPR